MARRRAWIGCIPLALAVPTWAEGPPPEPAITGHVTSGAYYSSADEFKFGEYTGFGEDEWNVLGDFELRGRPAWDSDQVWHFLLRGQDLGMDSRRIDADGGLQGLFRLHVTWDQIPHLLFDDGDIVFRGRGTDFLTLPPNWIGGQTTKTFTNLPEDLNSIRLERQRNDLRAGADFVLPAGFELSTHYLNDRQTGRKPIGSVIGNSGGNPRAVIVPEKIDWTTNDGDILLRYANDRAQAEVGYEISRFDDETPSLTWQNPFSAINGWDPAAGFPTGFGRRGLPPNNTFHQVKASGGYDLPYDTRIMAHAAFGWMFQNDNFLAYTDNPALIVTTPLPEQDAHAEIDTKNLGVRITSRPIEHLRGLAEWRLDDRDNDTRRKTFIYVPGDSQDQGTIAGADARRPLPESYRRNDGRVELGYEVWNRTEVTAAYQHLVTDRSWTEADEVKEDVFKAGIHGRPIQQLDFRVDANWSNRDGGDYFSEAPLVWGFSPEHVATLNLATDFENNPLLRKFNFADRERQGVDARVAVMPIDKLTLSGQLGFANEDYDNSELGLRGRRAITWTLDASWSPTESINAYAYYTNESFHSRQSGRSFSNEIQAFDPNHNWREQEDNHVDTVGAGVEWLAIADRVTLHADFAYSFATDNVDVEAGSAISPAPLPLPDNDSRLYDVSVQLEVKVVEHVKARIGYLFESFEADDWAVAGVQPSTINEVLTLGQKSPNYNAHLVGFGIEYEF